MSEYIVDTFGIVQDFADLHGDMSTPLYQAIMDVLLSRQHEEIVRCRDCTYYDDEPDLTSSTPKCWRDPEHRGAVIWTRPDGFCAWGERKVDA